MARTIPLEIKYSEEKLLAEINLLKDRFDVPKKDVRYDIKGTNVEILTDTKAGWILDEDEAMNEIVERLRNLDSSTVTLYLREDKPVVSSDNSDFRKEGINKMLQNNLVLLFEGLRFEISKATIGSWVVSDYRNNHLIPGLDRAAISGYVTTLAEKIDTTPKSSFAKVENGKVVEFVPPKQGRYLAQAETVELVIDSLLARPEGKEVVRELSLPVVVKRASGGDESAQNFGIVELLGKATTPFTGSPKNRVLNIENGTKFLNGVLIAPGEEFSTVTSLGKIDNTTGYFPELVIKGDRTVPEFGGGLCQVSTTLFRAVMDAGLPVTERRNHSYRVSYYEYDGEEKYIGPGLDATIYSPNPDFKFKNDTDSHILLQGYVVGDKITFELYGTGDGRTAEVDGPKLLYTTSPGEPIYVETDKLPAGEVIKLESAHPGGSAVAIYKIIYPDGRVNEQEFKSSYRRWPDRYLVGTAGVSGESALPVVR